MLVSAFGIPRLRRWQARAHEAHLVRRHDDPRSISAARCWLAMRIGRLAGVDRAELLSGADREFCSRWGQGCLPLIRRVEAAAGAGGLSMRRPRSRSRSSPSVSGAVLIDAAGEPPARAGGRSMPGSARTVVARMRWSLRSRGATSAAVLDAFRPKLHRACAPEADSRSRRSPALRDQLDGTGLVALEPGLALEV